MSYIFIIDLFYFQINKPVTIFCCIEPNNNTQIHVHVIRLKITIRRRNIARQIYYTNILGKT